MQVREGQHQIMALPTMANGGPAAAEGQTVPPVHNSSLYVGDLDRDVSEAQLFELFSQVRAYTRVRDLDCVT